MCNGRAHSQIGFGLISSMGASGQLHPARLARCNLRPLKTGQLFVVARNREVREPVIPCTGALCRLASGEFPLCRVVFSTAIGVKGFRFWLKPRARFKNFCTLLPTATTFVSYGSVFVQVRVKFPKIPLAALFSAGVPADIFFVCPPPKGAWVLVF